MSSPHQFLSIHFLLLFFFGLSRLHFGGRVKETGQVDVFVAGAIESHDGDDWLLIYSAFRPTLANFPISCNRASSVHPIDPVAIT